MKTLKIIGGLVALIAAAGAAFAAHHDSIYNSSTSDYERSHYGESKHTRGTTSGVYYIHFSDYERSHSTVSFKNTQPTTAAAPQAHSDYVSDYERSH